MSDNSKISYLSIYAQYGKKILGTITNFSVSRWRLPIYTMGGSPKPKPTTTGTVMFGAIQPWPKMPDGITSVPFDIICTGTIDNEIWAMEVLGCELTETGDIPSKTPLDYIAHGIIPWRIKKSESTELGESEPTELEAPEDSMVTNPFTGRKRWL